MRSLLLTTTIFSLAAGLAFAEPTPTPATPATPAVAAAPAAKGDFIPKEQWDKLSPEKKKAIKEDRFQKRKAERKEWKKKFEAASPEEKEKMKANLEAEHDANKAKWKERYDAATPEEKKKMEDRMDKRKERRAEWKKEHPMKEGGMMKDHKAATPAAPK